MKTVFSFSFQLQRAEFCFCNKVVISGLPNVNWMIEINRFSFVSPFALSKHNFTSFLLCVYWQATVDWIKHVGYLHNNKPGSLGLLLLKRNERMIAESLTSCYLSIFATVTVTLSGMREPLAHVEHVIKW